MAVVRLNVCTYLAALRRLLNACPSRRYVQERLRGPKVPTICLFCAKFFCPQVQDTFEAARSASTEPRVAIIGAGPSGEHAVVRGCLGDSVEWRVHLRPSGWSCTRDDGASPVCLLHVFLVEMRLTSLPSLKNDLPLRMRLASAACTSSRLHRRGRHSAVVFIHVASKLLVRDCTRSNRPRSIQAANSLTLAAHGVFDLVKVCCSRASS